MENYLQREENSKEQVFSWADMAVASCQGPVLARPGLAGEQHVQVHDPPQSSQTEPCV